MIRQKRSRRLDDPDLIFLVRTLPLGVADAYRFEEDAAQDARQRRDKGQRSYVVPMTLKESI